MALIKVGNLIQDIRGSVGGMVFSRETSGAMVRQKIAKRRGSSRWEQQIRRMVAGLGGRWKTVLTEGQRAEWEEWDKANPRENVYGERRTVGGANRYRQVNLRLLMCRKAPVAVPPWGPVPEELGLWIVLAKSDGYMLKYFVVLGGRTLLSSETLFVASTTRHLGNSLPRQREWVNLNLSYMDTFIWGHDLAWRMGPRAGLYCWKVGWKIWVRVGCLNFTTGAYLEPVEKSTAIVHT